MVKVCNLEIAMKKIIVLRPSALSFISRYRIYVYCIVYSILDKLSDTTKRQMLALYIRGVNLFDSQSTPYMLNG